MRKTKAKRGAFWQSQMLPFVIVWAIGIGGVAAFSRLWQIFPIPFFYNLPEERVALSMILSVILTGLLQVVLVERLLKKSMRGWILYTSVSILVIFFLDLLFKSNFFYFFYVNVYQLTGFYPASWFASLALNVPTSLLQFFWLRQRVKRAWLWPLMSIPLLMAFTAVPYGDNSQILKFVTLLCVGVVQAGLMHYFWQHTEDTDKTKNDHVENHEEGRIARLEEQAYKGPLWDHGADEQGLQSDAL